jgi:hypothetical protein
VEMALQIFSNFQQDNWSNWLPIIQYQLNSWVSSAIKQIPYETWMSFLPKAHQPLWESNLPTLKVWWHALCSAWDKVIQAIIYAQSLWKKTSRFYPYWKGDKVWLKGTHLHMFHPTHKLLPEKVWAL